MKFHDNNQNNTQICKNRESNFLENNPDFKYHFAGNIVQEFLLQNIKYNNFCYL